MARLSLRTAAAAILQGREREKLRKRRMRERAMQAAIENWVAPMEEEEEAEPEKKKFKRIDWKNCVAPDIPLDLLIEILTRLPAKSVLKFKCVSKFWSSLLSSRHFCNRFLMVTSQPRLYMTLLDTHHYSKSLLLSTSPSSLSPSTLVFDQNLTTPKMGGYDPRFLHGFIYFMYYLKVRIYNPSTRQLYIIPAIKESDIIAEQRDLYNNSYTIQYYMGHDPVNDQYKLLCTIFCRDMGKKRSEYWIFVLEAGGSWKRKTVAKDFHSHVRNPLELTMNGAIYYCAWTDTYTYVLVRFDVKSEELKMMQVPRRDGEKLTRLEKRVTQIDYGGKVAVFDMTYLKTGIVDLWVVEDWRKEEWSRKTLVLKPCQMHLVVTDLLIPKGHLNGKVILVPQFLLSPFYILYYDLQTNNLKRVEIKGIPDCWFSKPDAIKYFDVDFMHPSESIRDLEAGIKLFW